MTGLSRRTALRLAALWLAAHQIGGVSLAAVDVRSDPFTLGVASGDPQPDGFVLWTRLIGLEAVGAAVRWEVASDERFTRIVRRGTSVASPALGHSVHVEVTGLLPDRAYFYRFRVGGAASGVGRVRTAPHPDARLASARFAVACCQQWEHGWFNAYRDLVAQDPRLVLFLGDYIYERRSGAAPFVREFGAPQPTDLASYRARHALYKSDADLQAAHAACAWAVTWDDHEVSNDYAGATPSDPESDAIFRARRAGAYQAYFEHMPIRPSALMTQGETRLYRTLGLGQLADLHVLDGRQYRDALACPGAPIRGGRALSDCAELNADRTFLGRAQENWIASAYGARAVAWDVIANPALFDPVDLALEDRPTHWSDFWDGYPVAQARMQSVFADKPDARALILTGDLHSWWAFETPPAADAPRTATEFVFGSLASRPPRASLFGDDIQRRNPHLRHMNLEGTGYGLVDLSLTDAVIQLRIMDATNPKISTAVTRTKFTVDRVTASVST
jgi:alkaline phosphatase D